MRSRNERYAERGFKPAQRLVELVNAVQESPDLSRSELAELLVRHGERPEELTASTFTDADAADLRDAVQVMADVLAETDSDRVAHSLNTLLADHGAPPRLSCHDGHPWHLHVDRGEDVGWDEWFLASSALVLAQVMTEYGRAAWGRCAASGCGGYFLGTGPGSPRRYCSTACASRARVAEHRRRKRESS